MIANKEKGADNNKSVCDYNEFRRLRYFHGMLLDDNDFRAEQEYHTNKRRFLNRMMYGSGVVCGLGLLGKKEGRWIEVTSGFALDCSGNEIWVPRTIRIDLANLLHTKDQGRNQIECEEEEAGKPNTYYIGIRYEEKPSNPVAVYLPSGSCEERTCENSRYKEGFCVELVPCAQKEHEDGLIKELCNCPEEFPAPDPKDLPMCAECGGLENKKLCQCLRLEEFCEQPVPCPECEKSCPVVLGKIEVDKECRLVSICINECRRYVLTGQLLRHMLLGVFAGSEEYFNMNVDGKRYPIPNVAENPIEALCWFLRYKFIEGGRFEMLPCNKQERESDEQRIEKIVRAQVLAMIGKLPVVQPAPGTDEPRIIVLDPEAQAAADKTASTKNKPETK